MKHPTAENIKPAITVAMVSVSLSIALGIASGATPGAGLGTAIWGGLVMGAFGSSRYNIIGPAGGLGCCIEGFFGARSSLRGLGFSRSIKIILGFVAGPSSDFATCTRWVENRYLW
jgi:hypothetical protein